MADLVSVVRSLHILFAILWAGGSLYHGLIAMGSFFNGDADARRRWWARGKFGPYLGITSALTLVFGLWAYFAVGGPDAYSSGGNMVLSIGMLAGFVGVLVGWGGHMPTMIGLAKAVDAGDLDAIERLEHKEHLLDKISLWAVLIALVTMTTFRLF